MLEDPSNISLSGFQLFMKRERAKARFREQAFRERVREAQEALARGFAMPKHLLDFFSPSGDNNHG